MNRRSCIRLFGFGSDLDDEPSAFRHARLRGGRRVARRLVVCERKIDRSSVIEKNNIFFFASSHCQYSLGRSPPPPGTGLCRAMRSALRSIVPRLAASDAVVDDDLRLQNSARSRAAMLPSTKYSLALAPDCQNEMVNNLCDHRTDPSLTHESSRANPAPRSPNYGGNKINGC
jgi:hypothetical protein